MFSAPSKEMSSEPSLSRCSSFSTSYPTVIGVTERSNADESEELPITIVSAASDTNCNTVQEVDITEQEAEGMLSAVSCLIALWILGKLKI